MAGFLGGFAGGALGSLANRRKRATAPLPAPAAGGALGVSTPKVGGGALPAVKALKKKAPKRRMRGGY